MYLPPFEYVELFGAVQNRCLPDPAQTMQGADPFDWRSSIGIHYHKNYLTPYWDPEGGVAIDATYQAGFPIFGAEHGFQMVHGQVSTVKYMPDPFGWCEANPALSWLKETRVALRLNGKVAVPQNGQFFALGGADHFRGFDLRQRQGSATWTASVEWRIPLMRQLTWDVCDHFVGVRNIYLAPFYDIGDSYLQGHSFGPVAHAVGAGLRIDLAWLGLIERTMLRFDVAQTINVNTPTQFWVGVQHPF
jgi:hemolysin activation/secretion protein